MQRKTSKLTWLIAIMALLLITACGLGTQVKESGPVEPAPNPTTGPAAPVVVESQSPENNVTAPMQVGGPGDFNLPQPAVYADQLSHYQVELIIQFKGTNSGKPIERSTAMRLQVAGAGNKATRLEANATNESPVYLESGIVGDTRFIKDRQDGPCSSLAGSDEIEETIFGDPWSELPSVYGAELVDSETVNGLETQHYRFDQRAIRWASSQVAKGELWVAKEGGYLVRYRLMMQAEPGVLGAKAAGEQTWSFDLKLLPEDTQLLPEGCSPVLSGFPIFPGATQVVRMPYFTSYLAASDAAAVSEFYRQELAGAGWTEQNAFESAPERVLLLFGRSVGEANAPTGQELAAITLLPSEGGLRVEIQGVK